MPFFCKMCNKPALGIDRTVRFPPDDHSDDVSIQVLRCSACNRRALATYQASRRGSEERWHHECYPVPEDIIVKFENEFAACPSPESKRCTCPAHTNFDRKNYQPDFNASPHFNIRSTHEG
jgi:hypothetical protein